MSQNRNNEKKPKWKVTPEILSSKIDEEIVLLSIELGFFSSLDPVGSTIWEILSKRPSAVEELSCQLMEEYEVDKETCMRDVQEFIEDMVSKKLIIPVEEQETPKE